MLIGLTDASHTFRDDLSHGQVRVGHVLIIIRFFGILEVLPHFIDGLEAGSRYLDSRTRRAAEKGKDSP